jgi:quercetin dioxygenase-like cupin family protein
MIDPKGTEGSMKRAATSFIAISFLSFQAASLAGIEEVRAQQASEIKRTSLLQQDSTIAGYQAIMNIVEIPAGVREIKHTHPGPLSVYVLEGILTLEHEGRATATYKPGDAVLIEAGKVHQGINMGTVPVKLVATLIAEKGKPPTAPAP